jgi:acid stress chaperone HdeB
MRASCVVVFAVHVASIPARSQVLDLSTVTCKDFFEGSQTSLSHTLAWLDAYYLDEDAPPVIDFDKMKANGVKLAEYCAKNPTIGLITAADKLFDQ